LTRDTKIHKSGGLLPRAQLDDSALGNRLRSVTGEHLVAERIAARECAAGETPLKIPVAISSAR
jgi:hypothetical protein